ncbi:MAG: hypothetical protein JO123_02635 [Ktedonobacteraceae bacterium]|nr:hypothetical protein [Ktedonobacteraceae bacterium]
MTRTGLLSGQYDESSIPTTSSAKLLSGRYTQSPIPATSPAWAEPAQEEPTVQEQSRLPVLYQNGVSSQQVEAFQPNQMSMLPALPDEAHGAIYVPPMYTETRAIIPRYRAISGLLSVIVVVLLMCAGTGYYAKTSGVLSRIGQALGLELPQSVHSTAAAQLVDPPDVIDKGPAFNIIGSATTTSYIDPVTRAPRLTERAFMVNHLFYVTYSVQRPPQSGVVMVKWYTNGAFYREATSKPIKAGLTINGDSEMIYVVPANGMVELYWNDQLAQRLYFVVP